MAKAKPGQAVTTLVTNTTTTGGVQYTALSAFDSSTLIYPSHTAPSAQRSLPLYLFLCSDRYAILGQVVILRAKNEDAALTFIKGIDPRYADRAITEIKKLPLGTKTELLYSEARHGR